MHCPPTSQGEVTDSTCEMQERRLGHGPFPKDGAQVQVNIGSWGFFGGSLPLPKAILISPIGIIVGGRERNNCVHIVGAIIIVACWF